MAHDENEPSLITSFEKFSPQERIEQLDQLIRRLNLERSQTLSSINAESSYIRHIPSEVLVNIFKCAAPPIEFDPPRLSKWDENPYDTGSPWVGPNKYTRIRFICGTLAAVSATWCSVVHSTPELWTSVAIQMSPKKVKERISLLRLVFENCGILGIELEIEFKGFSKRYYYNDPILKGFLNLLQTHAKRIKILHIGNPPPDLHHHFGGRYTNLEWLDIYWSPSAASHFPSIKAESAPALHKLSLQSSSHMTLEWSIITSLNLSQVSVDTCALILLDGRCPNLVEFFCRSPRPSHLHTPTFTVRGPPSFPHMKEFGWECSNSFQLWNGLIFRNVRLPGLRTLYWPGVRPELEAPFISAPFFGLFSSTLTTLYLERPSVSEANLFFLFCQGLDPSSLIIEDCDPDGFKSIWHLLDPERWNFGEQGPMLLPNLREVLFIYTPNYGPASNLPLGSSTAMLDMLVNRRRIAPDKELRINAVNYKGFLWEDDSTERMVDLMRSGFPLEIYEFGELHPACDPAYSHQLL